MKSFKQYICLSVIFAVACSCSNDFLIEESFIDETSPIFISPHWEAGDYTIYCQGIGSSKFTIVHAPTWLDISAPIGQFIDNTTLLHCKAKTCRDFSEIGIYYSFITLSVEGIGKLSVPVAYITEGNPCFETATFVTLNPNNGYIFVLPVTNTGNGILLWYIDQHPAWLTLNDTTEDNFIHILPSNGRQNLHVSYNADVLMSENTSGKIVLITNDVNNPVVEITVQMDFGTPVFISWQSGTIDFGRTETTRPYSFSNQGNGPLIWKIEGCPEWLTVSESNGITQYYTTTLAFTCNRELLPSSNNTATIYLKTNDKNNPSVPITVTAHGNVSNPENIKEIQGNITDACMDKKTDILYLTTNQPNRFVAFDTKAKAVVRELSLNHAPTCFSISEDSRKAVIGHGGYISSVDMENFSVSKIVETDHTISNIEWGTDGWCCYSVPNVQWTSLYWVNLDSLYTDYSDQIYGSCALHKIPNQNYIIGAETMISGGIYVFDINTRKRVYRNSSFLGNFCFSENGLFTFSYSKGNTGFSNDGKVYRTSSFFTENYTVIVTPIAVFTSSPNRLYGIDHHAASGNVWVLAPSSDNYYDQQREIIQYDDNDYFRKKTYYYSDYYNNRPVQAQYVFANQAGTELIVIRNATEGNFMWSLEFIPVE